jgi:hypothetical protein
MAREVYRLRESSPSQPGYGFNESENTGADADLTPILTPLLIHVAGRNARGQASNLLTEN